LRPCWLHNAPPPRLGPRGRAAPPSEMQKLYDMITCDAAQAMGIQDFELKVGGPAHLVVLNQPDVLEALRHHDQPAYVISHGKLVDKARWMG